MIDREFIEKIEEMSKNEIVEHEGLKYSTKTLKIVSRPQVASVLFHTLMGFVEFINKDLSGYKFEKFVQILNHDTVRVISSMDVNDRGRDYFAEAKCSIYTPDFNFNQYMNQEDFLIELQSKFVNTQELSDLLKLAGNVSDTSSVQLKDDGVSQSVNVKTNIALESKVTVKSIVKLAPYRTFREIAQPESDFLFRIKRDDRQGTQFALFVADGASWKLEAIKRIKNYLSEQLKNVDIFA